MPSAGDALLFAVSARRQLSWRAFTDTLDTLFVPDPQLGSDVKQVRSAVASLGSSLAHWDVVPEGQTARVVAAPPCLARLPWPGAPRAVLCGARSPDTITAVQSAGKRLGISVRTAPQEHIHRYAPSLIEVRSESDSGLADLSRSLRLRYRPVPAAWALTCASSSVDRYTASLEWSAGPDIDWLRRDFDPGELRFVRVEPGTPRTGLTLSAYENPAGWARVDRLWQDGDFATAHRDWARFAVLAGCRRTITSYDHRTGTFRVPRQVPLPTIPARALGLCSGQPPRIEAGDGLGTYAYPAVPLAIASALATKLGQHGGDPTSDQGGAEA